MEPLIIIKLTHSLLTLRINSKSKCRYARTQELFRKAPSKLAEMVVAGDLSLLKDPEERKMAPIIRLKEVYDDLWGHLCRLKFNYSQQPLIDTAVAVPPFKFREIWLRIKQLKAKGALGPDGLCRNDILVAGIELFLLKIYTLIFITGHYPRPWLENRTTSQAKEGSNQSLGMAADHHKLDSKESVCWASGESYSKECPAELLPEGVYAWEWMSYELLRLA